MERTSAAGWRKASYSGTNGGNCTEVGQLTDGIAVRDSRDRSGEALAFSPQAWATFTARIK